MQMAPMPAIWLQVAPMLASAPSACTSATTIVFLLVLSQGPSHPITVLPLTVSYRKVSLEIMVLTYLDSGPVE